MTINQIFKIDHTVYAVPWNHQESFIKRWSKLGFYQLFYLRTAKFPAIHIALANQTPDGSSERTMIGLSVSDVPTSPINEFISRYGEGIQHTAYTIHPEVNIDELYEQMKQQGWKFMTPVLTYEDEKGAKLKQLYTAPNVPYGQFIELVQRPPLDQSGKTFESFDTQNIDDFYQYYADYSQYLERLRTLENGRAQEQLNCQYLG